MQDAGVEIVVDAATLSVVGITEVFSKLPGILQRHGCCQIVSEKLTPGSVDSD